MDIATAAREKRHVTYLISADVHGDVDIDHRPAFLHGQCDIFLLDVGMLFSVSEFILITLQAQETYNPTIVSLKLVGQRVGSSHDFGPK